MNPETVLDVRLATYKKFFAGVSARATGRGLVGNDGSVSEVNSPVDFSANAEMELAPGPTT